MFVTLAAVIAPVLLPFTELGRLFGFVFLLLTAAIGAYVLSAELTKRLFYRHEGF